MGSGGQEDTKMGLGSKEFIRRVINAVDRGRQHGRGSERVQAPAPQIDDRRVSEVRR